MQEQDENCVERHTLRIEEPLGERIGAKCRNLKDYTRRFYCMQRQLVAMRIQADTFAITRTYAQFLRFNNFM